MDNFKNKQAFPSPQDIRPNRGKQQENNKMGIREKVEKKEPKKRLKIIMGKQIIQ